MFGLYDRPPADPIALPLTNGPWPVVSIVGIYLIFVLNVGRQYMENRKPYDLRRVLKIYNLVQMIYNGLMFAGAVYALFGTKAYNLGCLDPLPLEHWFKNAERAICYAYFLNKIVDLLDTVFIVLRKSYRQITALHLIHHASMVVGVYGGLRFYGYGGHFAIMGLLNTFVHVVMYGYYYVASQSEAVKENRSWKRYITIIQMVQFSIVLAHSVWSMVEPSCNIHPLALATSLGMGTLFFVLFANFYAHAYILPKQKAKQP